MSSGPPPKRLKQTVLSFVTASGGVNKPTTKKEKCNNGDDILVSANNALLHAANARNFHVLDMPGDGNCALHAISHQMSLHGIVIEPRSLRQRAVAFLRCHPLLMDSDFLVRSNDKDAESYLRRQSLDGQWIDEIMLRAVGACIERQIKILHDNGHTTTINLTTESEEGRVNSTDPINIGLIAEMHYVSLVNATMESNNYQPSDTVGHECADAAEEDWPSVWSSDVWFEKLQTYPFLKSWKGKIGCKTCTSVDRLHTYSGRGRNLSEEWVNCQVEPNGKDRVKQLRSLRKKIFQHQNSATHISAESILKEREKESMEKVVGKMCVDEQETTSKAFRTAYYLAKNNRPFTDYQSLLELQDSNGAKIGAGLRSRYSATEMVIHISEHMTRLACKEIIAAGNPIAVLIDESTTVSNKSTLIVYLKCMSTANVEPHFMFLQLLELEDQKATTITETLLRCLHHFGFSDDYLMTHLVAFASDGASVMTGTKSGVARLLADKFPNVIPWHCLNHRLELAVGDAADEVQGVSHFRIFMDSLYSLYSRSPKTQKQVEKEAAELDVQLKKIGRVLNTRWVASSFRTVQAVWNNFEALAAHFRVGADPKSMQYDGSLGSKYIGLRNKLCSPDFVADLGVMYDSLEELSVLSEQLQRRNISVPEADKIIRRSIRRIEHMKEKPGPKMKEANSSAETLVFNSTKLQRNAKHGKINIPQFLTSIANNLRSRLLGADYVTATSNVNATRKPNEEEERRKKLASLLSNLTVLDPNFWPTAMDDDYGEDEIRQLCTHFRLPYGSIRNAYCDYKDSGGKQINEQLKPLMNSVNTIPCSTSECERGFSAMNLIITDLRSTLLVQNVSALMFIKINGPPLALWKPEKYVQSWLLRHRSATDSRTRTAEPTCTAEIERPSPLWNIF